jgi:hypothetical protein
MFPLLMIVMTMMIRITQQISDTKIDRPASDPVCTSNMWAGQEGDQSRESSDVAINPSGSGIGSTFRWRPYVFMPSIERLRVP